MDSIFAELSLVIVVTAAVSILMRAIKQPLILGYILAGLIVGPSILDLIHSKEIFETFSELGIALLLFIIGLGMNIGELKKLGKVVLLISGSTLFAITLLGYATSSSLFGFSTTEALITGLALFFSSTIIIVKILSDKREQNQLHAKIAIGVILVEDVIATLALLFIAAGKDGFDPGQILFTIAKGTLLVAALIYFSAKILPPFVRYMASTQELLFLFAISWGFGVATLFEMTGFSIHVGALFAGVALASSPYVQAIAARLKPLRDFFIVVFFITLGESLTFNNLSSSIIPAIILSVIVITAKPLIVTFVMGFFGYAKRVSFKTGIHLSQISEFSIILAVLAVAEGMVRPELVSIITLVAIITITTSTYLMINDEYLYQKFKKIRLHMFESEVSIREKRSREDYQLVLFGYHHGGHEFINAFKNMGKKYLVIDYDPEVIDLLEHRKIDYLYGDATDEELIKEASIDKAKLVISTISDHQTNLQLAKNIEEINPNAVLICHADNLKEASDLYDTGASYVMIPHHLGIEKISSFIKSNGLNKSEFKKYRQKHLAYLETHLTSKDPE